MGAERPQHPQSTEPKSPWRTQEEEGAKSSEFGEGTSGSLGGPGSGCVVNVAKEGTGTAWAGQAGRAGSNGPWGAPGKRWHTPCAPRRPGDFTFQKAVQDGTQGTVPALPP